MTVQYVDGRFRHCGQIARMLRGEHAGAIVALGYNPHRELRAMLDASSFSRAMLIEGKLAALGGVVGPAIAPYGHVWLAISAGATARPRVLFTEAQRTIREIALLKHDLVTTILDGDASALRFACHLGFIRANIEARPGLIPMRLDLRS